MIRRTKATDVNGEYVNIRPNPSELVNVKHTGNVTELKYVRFRGKGGTTIKLSKTEYLDTRSGEIKQFKEQSKRSDDCISVVRSITQGRDIIRANCIDPKCCRFLTLTYANNMTNSKKLANDYKNFLKRLPEDIKPFKWVSAVEPQKRGAWHIHAIFVYENTAPFIDSDILFKAWKQGFVNVKSVVNCDDMGAYLCAYLTDLEVSESEVSSSENCKLVADRETGETKRIIKGARLNMYPSGMHIFRWSANCTKPKFDIMEASEAEKLVANQSLVYETTSCIEDTESGFKNTINTRVYNKARKGVQ